MILKQLGCDNGQGFIFSRPQAADDLAGLLDEEEAPDSRAAAAAA
jgi:EAL domain-containing protein (putative c-di-GMP-specific phosphodiesterase class I)